MTIKAKPEHTYALVVGIEKYNAGDGWKLNGPASDAARFVQWLRKRNVPADNIFLFLSPLDEISDMPPFKEDKNLLGEFESRIKPATKENINNAVIKRLQKKQGDLLFVFWGGHGIITRKKDRRLFYADATTSDKLNLDIDSLLEKLNSDHFGELHQQIVFIDACANYVERSSFIDTLPKDTFAAGKPLTSHQQFTLLAAKPGEYARNLSEEQTGLFSKHLLVHLNDSNTTWPPDMISLRGELQKHFENLRQEGEAEQSITYFYSRDWDGSITERGSPDDLNKKIRILIGDDDPIVVLGLKAAFQQYPDIEYVGEIKAPSRTSSLIKKVKADVVIMDLIWRGDEEVGIEQIEKIKTTVNVIAFTAKAELLKKARQAGAEEAIEKGITSDELVEIIREVVRIPN